MSDGITIGIERPAPRLAPLWRALCGGVFYAALWGGLSSMAFLAGAGLAPLLAGGVLALALPLLPKGKRLFPALLGLGLIAAAALVLAQGRTFLDGCAYLVNRLFSASAARQAYEYELLPLAAADGLAALRYALVPLGLLAGLACGAAARFSLKWPFVLMLALFCAAAAYLGVSPATGWMLLLAASALLPFLNVSDISGTLTVAVIPAAMACVLVLALFPGEDARLSAWDESARDYLAAETVAYTDRVQHQAARETERAAEDARPRQEELSDVWDDAPELPLPLILAITLTALLLFAPAIYSDRLKRRRARNRAGLDDPDPGASVRANFLYAMRWLFAGEIQKQNRPYGEYAGEIAAAYSPALGAEFESVLPLWREAAYSEHVMSDAQRGAMRDFALHAARAVWNGLGKKDRLRIKYIEAL